MAMETAQIKYRYSFLKKKNAKISWLYPDGYLYLVENPGRWIQSNPIDCLSVRTLELYNLKEDLRDSIVELSQLTHLSFNHCVSLKYLPNSITWLANVQVLEFHFCSKLKGLPANLGELKSVTHLCLHGCDAIKFLPNSLVKIPKLTTLVLDQCRSVTELPANLKIVNLKLRSCYIIKCLPKGLSHLHNLHLQICNYSKEYLANVKGLRTLRHLTLQSCYQPHNCCGIIDLLDNLDQLPELLLVNIESSQLRCLPWSITKLPKLRFLFLPQCFILETLPYHLNDSVIVSVKSKLVRKTWKELKTEMGPCLFSVENREMPMIGAQNATFISPLGYLQWHGAGDIWLCIQYIHDLKFVKFLDLDYWYDDGKEYGDFIKELTELTHLYVPDSNCLQHLPNTVMGITHLSLRDRVSKGLSLIQGKLPNLTSLDLYLQESELRASMDLLVSLRHLTLRSGGVESLPDSLAKLSNLETLELHDFYDPISVPAKLSLTRVKLLNTSFNSLPTGLHHLEILHDTSICVKEYCCNGLEEGLNQLFNLKTLSVTCCFIEFVPVTARLNNLRDLQLKDCFSLKELPPNLDEMVKLCSLNISGTRIKSLPDNFMNLPNLQYLILPKCFAEENFQLIRKKKSIMVSTDDIDDSYYQKRGYYHSMFETSRDTPEEDIEITPEGSKDTSRENNVITPPGSVERIGEVTSKESEEDIITEQQLWSHLLQNRPDTTILGDSQSNGRNDPIDENSHHAFCSSENQVTEIFPCEDENWTAHVTLSNLQESRFLDESSQHDLHQVQVVLNNKEIEAWNAPSYQHSSLYDARNLLVGGKEIHVLENGQNNESLQGERTIPKTATSKGKKKDITQEDILNLLPRNMTLVSAAKVLEVSRSTMKRKLKEFGIKWPSSRNAKKMKHGTKASSGGSSAVSNLVAPTISVGIEHAMERSAAANQYTLSDRVSFQRNAVDNSATTAMGAEDVPAIITQIHIDRNELAQECQNGANQGNLSSTVRESNSSCNFVVKATYKGDAVRFDSFSSSVAELKEEMADNLELELGRFKIKYEDDDKEWMLMTKNKHLEYALKLSKSSGKNILRLLVIDL